MGDVTTGFLWNTWTFFLHVNGNLEKHTFNNSLHKYLIIYYSFIYCLLYVKMNRNYAFFVCRVYIQTCCLCLLAYSGTQHILWCIFVVIVFVLCTLCCQFVWIVHVLLPLRYSLTFIYDVESLFDCTVQSRDIKPYIEIIYFTN
jgi:hypothetical protein